MKRFIINFLVWLRIMPQERKIFKETLSKADQIEILEKAVNDFDRLILKHDGICLVISSLIEEKLQSPFVYYANVHKYIPLFTYENCKRLSKQYNFSMNPYIKDYYWFSKNGRVNRLKCLEALLTELKKEK